MRMMIVAAYAEVEGTHLQDTHDVAQARERCLHSTGLLREVEEAENCFSRFPSPNHPPYLKEAPRRPLNGPSHENLRSATIVRTF